jgi:hypothetical protein
MNAADAQQKRPPPIQMAFGWIIAAVLIFLAQRDLGRRSPEAVRGPVALWRVVAGTPPGAVAYLVFGRRRRSSDASSESATEATVSAV